MQRPRIPGLRATGPARPAAPTRALRDALPADAALPAAVVDGIALRGNADLLRSRAGGRPIRLATKSIRCRHVLDLMLAEGGFAGLMCFSLREALWLASLAYDDLLVAYPTVDRSALAQLAADPAARDRITVMVDDPDHVALLAAVLGAAPPGGTIRVALDVDSSLRLAGAHLGARRSPLRTGAEAAELTRRLLAVPGVVVDGMMFYDAQIAGLPDSSPAVRGVKALSHRELSTRRGDIRAAVERELATAGRPPLRVVNGGGSGSLHVTGADPALTELAAGSGLYAPTSFDGFVGWEPTPALFTVHPVVRRPAQGFVTIFGGGYIASGAAGASRLPTPVWPEGMTLLGTEGAGEVQTPLRCAGEEPRVGERVWLRPTKAGEPLERFENLWFVDSGGARFVPTYRGEGRCFG